jgi:AraC-like DNA-binding protein
MRVAKPSANDSVVRISGDASEWSRALSAVFVDLEVEQLNPEQKLTSQMYSYPFGDLTLIRAVTRGGPHLVKRTEALIQQSNDNIFFIGFMLAGDATLSQDDHRAELHPGDIAILDSSRAYVIDVPGSFDALWVSVPRYRLEGRLHSLSDIMAQRIDGSTGVGHVASSMLSAALNEAPRMQSSEANRIANHLLDLLSLSLAERTEATRGDRATTYSTSMLRRVQEYVEQHLDDEELSPEQVATAQNVSVRYVNKLFAREGTSVARWIRIRRLERCRMDLENSDNVSRSISDIAYSHGFGNISSFNRAFRSRFGLSPRTLRNDEIR